MKNNLQYQARRVLILGTSGTGKSTLIAKLIDSHPAQLVLVYDWQGGEICKRVSGLLVTSRAAFVEAVEAGHRIVCYDAETGEEDEKGAGFDWFCETCFTIAGEVSGRVLIVVDECQELIDPQNLPEPLGDILSRGRRREMDTCIAARSANALETEARDQVTELYVFRLVDERSLKYPKSVGLDADAILNLPDTSLVYRDMRTGEQKRLELWDESEQIR